ncbi:HNH/ENDO VII family nuclease [Pectobacterium brasiliense]|uniref:HNH/ENDO VII family nuclease n=1 Tax=Pectobacterium brasiliense TaxID=180957 RepID=UPI0015DFD9D4|nr:HNH/ENDO VII family nuclease [Pectobacterium brasiliense]MBA0217822.1 HNH/ENDO VII family nuclease [Pectobacterium brasiliense]MBN3073862.1 HNH/ENDO VII family nuclease [Pectobacterium brasiliense]MBN3169285.1 HNH/ENDO VII family nuclease [Pectobacterium brasiliense]
MIEAIIIKELEKEMVGTLMERMGELPSRDVSLKELDKPIFIKQATEQCGLRLGLTELTEETKEVLTEDGYSKEVIDNIGSEEEATIYQEAGLECQPVNGKDALVNNDIDLEQTDALGNTNLERMEMGKPPLDENGKPIELHHIGQKSDSPLAELTHEQHMEGGNNTVLHDTTKESEIDRGSFAKEREDHWKARAEEIKQRQEQEGA